MSVPAPIELSVKNDTIGTSAFCQGHDLLRVYEGGLSVIMVMEDCQCSYTGLFDQVRGVIRNGRVISNLSLHHIFIYRKVVWHKDATFFFSSATRTDMKSKGSCLALVCVSIKFIDFIFLVSLLTHFNRKTKQNIQKQTTKKEAKNKTKQNKINTNKTHTKSKRCMYVNFLILKISTLMWDSNLPQITLLSHRQTLYQLS